MSRLHATNIVLASVFALVLTACGSSSPAATASPGAATNAPSAAAAPSSAIERLRATTMLSGSSICPLLSEAALRRHFPSAPAEMETHVGDKTYPSCTYLWVSATPSKMIMAGQEVEIGGEGRVTLTVAPVRVPESDWQRVLSSYRIKPPVAVAGIGDKAVWSDQRNQLSVLAPGWVVHVAVEDNDTPGPDSEKAVAIARDILAGLR